MAPQSKNTLDVRPPRTSSRSPSRSPRPKNRKKAAAAAASSYQSDGVTNNNIFNLPTSDYKVMVLVTIVAAVVRLFRIYQPTSVVFDEVQYVLTRLGYPFYV